MGGGHQPSERGTKNSHGENMATEARDEGGGFDRKITGKFQGGKKMGKREAGKIIASSFIHKKSSEGGKWGGDFRSAKGGSRTWGNTN